ncbi:hypothetical protein JW756_02765 [Candidatus Woesearchaeota archaeon]|nr:hypothetical protein [Candidatus Woesearchaeota archaeon]
MNIIVRAAAPRDASEIRQIAAARRVSSSSNERSGLIDYPVPDESKYAKRILCGLFYASENENTKEIVGFLDAYVSDSLKETFPGDPIINRIIHSEAVPFIYVNTVAIIKNYEARGVPYKLFKKLRGDIDEKYLAVWGAIVHKPLMNITSVAMVKRLGFSLEEEIKAFENFTFGLYRLSLDHK